MNMQDTLKQYLELYEKARVKVSDDSIAMGLVEQVGKDLRVQAMRRDSAGEQNAGETQFATDKQIGFLKKLGVSVNSSERLTKAQASKLIDEAQERIAAL
jgi:hypothetical protein